MSAAHMGMEAEHLTLLCNRWRWSKALVTVRSVVIVNSLTTATEAAQYPPKPVGPGIPPSAG
jgi:hypothetical protein